MDINQYRAFLETKKTKIPESGFELKESYFNEAVKNIQSAEAKVM